MFKVFGFIARRPDITAEQFHEHYRHPHGTLARGMPTLLSYTQSHQIDTDLLDDTQHRFEAIMEVRLADTRDWFGFRTNSYLVEHLLDDEPNFLDPVRCAGIAVSEELLPEPPRDLLSKADALWSLENASLPIKLVQIVPVERRDLWACENDADLGHRIGALHHVRSRALPELQPPGAEFCGIRELYWPTVAAFRAGLARDTSAWQLLVERTRPAVTLLAQCEKFF